MVKMLIHFEWHGSQEIFSEYRPSGIHRGLPHPGSIAEATSLRLTDNSLGQILASYISLIK